MPSSFQSRHSDPQPFESERVAEKASGSSVPDVESKQDAPWLSLFYFTTISHLPPLILGLFTAIISGLSSPAQSLLLGEAFGLFTDYSSGKLSGSALLSKEVHYVYYMLGIGAGSWLVHFLFFSSWLAFGELQAKSARDRLFQGMLQKEMTWFDMRKNGIRALIPRLQIQIRDLQLATSQPLGAVIAILAEACFSFGLAMYYSWKLTLVIFATVPVLLTAVAFIGNKMQPNIIKQQERLTQALKFITNSLNSIETVKCFNGQDLELEKYVTKIGEARPWYRRVVNINAQQSAITQFLGSVMFVQGFYYGAILVDDKQKSTAAIITTFMSAVGAFTSLSGILSQMLVVEKGRTAGATLRAVMAHVGSLSSNLENAATEVSPTVERWDIRFEHVSFAYPTRPDHLALQDVTVFFPHGELLFVVGRSGSGKSTIGQLLAHFYPSSSGDITVDGQSISELNTNWLRRNVVLVEQTSTLFNTTIADNVTLGRGGSEFVSEADVQQALEFALMRLAVDGMPEGSETLVGSRGASLSGGQRQRLALARAKIGDPQVLILDESTSALDQVNRTLMHDAIREWRKGRTTIIITHDISQIGSDDYTYVFEQGRLVQEGYRKHMERMKGTPFQDFLSDTEKAYLSPFDSRRHTNTDLWVRKQSELMSEDSHISPQLDTSKIQTQSRGNKRTSILTKFLADRGMHTALHTHAVGAAVAHTHSPWLQTNLISARTPDSDHTSWSPRSGSLGVSKTDKRASRGYLESKQPQSADTWDTMLNRAGLLAVRTRAKAQRHRQGRPLGSDIHDRSTENGRSLQSNRTSEAVPSLISLMANAWSNLSKAQRLLLVLGLLFSAGHAVVTPVFSYILSKLIETYGTGSRGKHKALVYSMVILGLSVFDACCVYFMHVLLERTGQSWVDNLRRRAVERILDQPRDFFARDHNSVSQLVESLDRHAEEMRNLIGRFLPLITVATVMIVASLVWALATQWKLTLITLSVAPYVYFVTHAFGAISSKWEGHSNDASEATNSVFTETFTSIKTVKSLTLETYFAQKHTKATDAALQMGLQRALYSGFFYGLSDSSGIFTQAMVFYVGAKLAEKGTSVSHIIQVFVLLIITITNVSSILAYIPQMSSSKDSATRLLRSAELPQDSHEHDGNLAVSSVQNILIRNVRFHYPTRPEQAVLRDLSLDFPLGSSTAIVGPSGSGKSTIAGLLLKLYTTGSKGPPTEPRAGEISIAGRDIRHLHTPSLRSRVAIVSQTPTLFAASIRDNITYGLPPHSQYHSLAAVREAAEAACIDEFIMSLPAGYSTEVGDGGMELSGGQAQRVVIARALVRKPDVLILDEATSALDPKSATLIRDTIQSLLSRQAESRITVIIITHSREMMELAGEIVLLDQGRLIEKGKFEELLAKRGALHTLLNGGTWTGPSDMEDWDVPRLRGMHDVDWQGVRRARKESRGKQRAT